MNEIIQNVLSASFQGGVVIAVVLLLRLVLKKAPKKYTCLLWILVGLRLLLPFSIESELSLQPQLPEMGQVQPALPQTSQPATDNVPVVPVIPAAPDIVKLPENNDVQIVVDNNAVAEEHHTVIDWKEIALWAWVAGACGLGLYSIVSYIGLKRRVREAVKLSGGIWECDRIDTAFILGYLRPRIYIPMGIRKENHRFILEHERMHLRRGDHWFKLMGFLALTVHWFNPLVWIAYILLCRDIEMACDERVVQSMGLEERKSYSAALLSCSSSRAHFAACPVAFGEVSVKQRIVSVLNYRKPRFWISLVAVVAVILVAVCFLTDPKGNDWETECRAVLEKIQSSENYHIRVEGEFEGEIILDDWNEVEYWKYGEDLLRIVKNQDSGMLDGVWYDGIYGYMSLDGEYYEGISANQQMTWQKENVSVPDPWLYSFDMDAQDVEATARKETDEGYEIRLMVYGPCDSESIKCDEYYVDFCFDREGNFRYAIRYIYGTGELMGETLPQSIISTMYAYEPTKADFVSAVKSHAGNLEQELERYLSTATVQPEKELAECRAVLDQIQSSENYHILSQRQFEGYGFDNDVSESEFWKHGDDWLRISRTPATGNALAYMGVDGMYFDNVWMKEDGWQQVDMSADAIFDPWLYSFDWNAQEIELIETRETGEGHSVLVQINAPYDLEWISSEDYTAEFIFDAAGNFAKAVLTAQFEEEINGQTNAYSVVETLTVRGTDADAIAAAIDEQYRQTEQGQMSAQLAVQRLAELKAEDITSIDNPRVSAEEIVPALNRAVENPVERTEDIQQFWFVYIYLTGADEYMILSAGPEENAVQILYRNGEMRETCYVEDAALYQIIRSSAYADGFVDEIALAKYEDVLRTQVEETMRQVADTWQFTGYEFTAFTRLDTFEKDGKSYDVYAWDVAFLADDPTQVLLAGGMGIDGELRVRGIEPNSYFVVTGNGEDLNYRFFTWELYLGPEESEQANAWSKIRQAFSVMSQAELQKFQELFAENTNADAAFPVDPYNVALAIPFESPEKLNLNLFFNNGFLEERTEFTAAEREFLEARNMPTSAGDTVRLPVEKMDEALTRYFGLTLAQMEGNGLATMAYNLDTRCYYLDPGGVLSAGEFTFIDGYYLDDGIVQLYYINWLNQNYVFTMVDTGGGTYRFLSNVPCSAEA